jgi:hypothetical protein
MDIMTQHVLTFIGSYHKVSLAEFDVAYTQGSNFLTTLYAISEQSLHILMVHSR